MKRAELIQRMEALALGRGQSFDAVFDQLWPLAVSFASKLGHGTDAEDVAQAALSKAFLEIARYRPGSDPVPWVLTLVAYEGRTQRNKRQRRREAFLENAEAADSAPGPEEQLIERDLFAAAVAVVDELSESDQAILRRALDDDRLRPWTPAERKRKQRMLDRLAKAFWRRHD